MHSILVKPHKFTKQTCALLIWTVLLLRAEVFFGTYSIKSSAEHPHRPHICIRILIKSKSSPDSRLLGSSKASTHLMVSINCLISQQNTGLTHTHPPHCVWSRPTNCRTVASYTCTLASFSPATGISLDWYNHSRPSVHHLHVLIPSLPPKRQTRLPLLPSLNLNLGCHNRDSKEYNFYAIIQNKRTYLLVPFCLLDLPSLGNRERLSEWIKQFLKKQITIMLWHVHCTHLHSDKSTLSVFIQAPPI